MSAHFKIHSFETSLSFVGCSGSYGTEMIAPRVSCPSRKRCLPVWSLPLKRLLSRCPSGIWFNPGINGINRNAVRPNWKCEIQDGGLQIGSIDISPSKHGQVIPFAFLISAAYPIPTWDAYRIYMVRYWYRIYDSLIGHILISDMGLI